MGHIRCPGCEQILNPKKPPTPGKKIRCPRCSHIFLPELEDAISSAPAKKRDPSDRYEDEREDDRPRKKRRDDEDDDEDRPRSRKKRRDDEDEVDDRPRKKRRDEDSDDDDDRPARKRGKSKKKGRGLLIPLLAGGGVLFAIVVIIVVFAGGLLGNAAVTKANWDKIQIGMTQGEVEEILGKGTLDKDAELANFLGKDIKFQSWRSGSNQIVCGFAPSKKYGNLCFQSTWIAKVGAGTERMEINHFNPELIRESREKNQKKK